MQNNNYRFSLNQQLGRALNDIAFNEHDYISKKSTLNTRTDFRIDKKNMKRKGIEQRRNLTFNELIAEYGYIEDESMTKKERIREWHTNVKSKKHNDSDSSSNDSL